jgi:hypothetical protein
MAGLGRGTLGLTPAGLGLGTGNVDTALIQDAQEQLFKRIPKLRGLGFNVVDSRGTSRDNRFGRYEFFQPGETRNHPNPGKPTVEIYQGQDLLRLGRDLFGEALHFAPKAIPEFKRLRQKYKSSLTPEQKAVDQRAYKHLVDNFGETRSFDKWFDVSRLDAHIRGFLSPDDRDEWRDSYSKEQLEIFKRMTEALGAK